jgi:hypothetical protein
MIAIVALLLSTFYMIITSPKKGTLSNQKKCEESEQKKFDRERYTKNFFVERSKCQKCQPICFFFD